MSESDVYGEVNSKADLEKIFGDIRRDVDHAKSREQLTELYRRAGYLITLTYAPSWEKKFGDKAAALRQAGEEEFKKTARQINHRAGAIGTQADYDESWGKH
jgi:hypothetical protein